MPAQKTPKLSLRLNYAYKKKDGSYQVLIEVRNYTLKPFRVKVMLTNKDTGAKEILCLAKKNLVNGRIVSSINTIGEKAAYLNKLIDDLKSNLECVLYYLPANQIEINKQNVENYLYNNLPIILKSIDRAQYNAMIESDQEVEIQYQTYQKELEVHYKDYKPAGLIEAMDYYQFSNIRNEYIKPILTKYIESTGDNDIYLASFDDVEFNKFVEFVKVTPSKKGEPYKLWTLKNFVGQIKHLLAEIKKKDIPVPSSAIEFTIKTGKKKDSTVKYNVQSTSNNFSLRISELAKILNAEFDEVALNNAKELFLIQIYCGGLRHSDLLNLRPDSFIEMNGEYKIINTNEKTGKVIKNELPFEAVELLKKHNFDLSGLFFKSHTGYNSALRRMAKKLNLNREIYQFDNYVDSKEATGQVYKLYDLFSNKLARKSIVSILFNQGVPINHIIKFTQHSLTAVESYISLDMEETEKKGNINRLFKFKQ
tara:strand:+ start:2432 stop:3871 length:1440 start_codon:yes stop_codon:yes gene_type:complete